MPDTYHCRKRRHIVGIEEKRFVTFVYCIVVCKAPRSPLYVPNQVAGSLK